MSRRTVLRWGGVAGAGVVVVGSGLAADEPLLLPALVAEDAPPPRLVARAADGLLLELSFANLAVVRPRFGFGPPQLQLIDAARPGFVRIGLGAQSLGEQTVPTAAPVPRLPVTAAVAGPSRVVGTVPARSQPVTFDLATLLNLAAFPLAVSPLADLGGTPAAPGENETAIEAPWRLVLSPPSAATFLAARGPVIRGARTELWHARVVNRRGDGTPDPRSTPVPVRAIWTPDLAGGAPPVPPDTAVPLTAQERRDLVTIMTARVTDGRGGPAAASLLLVSPLGASLAVDGAWPDNATITAWKHRSQLGRDTYVKVDKPGFLFPFGFRATLVKITERELRPGEPALLRTREFVVVREPVVTFPGPGQPDGGRGLPFLRAETPTLLSPDLAVQADREGGGAAGAFWVAGPTRADLVRYRLLLDSHDGRRVSADLPAIFVPETVTDLGPVAAAFNGADEGDRRTLRLDGQKVCFVPRMAEDPALPTFKVVLTADAAAAGSDRLGAYPRMATAAVRVEVLDAVGGAQNTGTENPGTTIELAPQYLATPLPAAGAPAPATAAPAALPANPGEVWAMVRRAVPTPDLPELPRLEVPQQVGGGLAAPALAVEGLSRAFGPVADPAMIAQGTFRPEMYFPLDEITLLGGIALKDVLAAVPDIPDPRLPEGDGIPKVVTVRTPTAVDTTVTWRPVLKDAPKKLLVPGPAPDNRLELRAVFHTELATGATSTTVTGDLRNFTLNFVGVDGPTAFISQKITRLHFESRDGAKPTVDVQLGKTTFQGQLAFLADLQELLPALPGGIKIDLTPSGVSAGLSIPVPAVALGVLLIQNLAIGVLLDLPFNGDQAALTFSFASREKPFQLTVSALGGGGFLAIRLGTRGVQGIEGSLEFGAAVAIDIGVASGSVSIMAGIYVKYEAARAPNGGESPGGPIVIITGFVRAIGKLDVLGIIHISVEFYLGLSFEAGPPKRLVGVARVTVRVEVLLFSTSVELEMRKEFGGGPDPTFGQQISAADWSAYCGAFAA